MESSSTHFSILNKVVIELTLSFRFHQVPSLQVPLDTSRSLQVASGPFRFFQVLSVPSLSFRCLQFPSDPFISSLQEFHLYNFLLLLVTDLSNPEKVRSHCDDIHPSFRENRILSIESAFTQNVNVFTDPSQSKISPLGLLLLYPIYVFPRSIGNS